MATTISFYNVGVRTLKSKQFDWETDGVGYILYDYDTYKFKANHRLISDIPIENILGFGQLTNCQYAWSTSHYWFTSADDIKHFFKDTTHFGGAVLYCMNTGILLNCIHFNTMFSVSNGTVTIEWTKTPDNPNKGIVLTLAEEEWPYPARKCYKNV